MTQRLLEATYRAEANHFWFRGLAEFSQALIEQAVTGVAAPEILDCGCGTGANMKRLSRYGRVTGFDLTWEGLQFARSYDQHRLVHASATDIPFAGGSFDVVAAFDILACLDEAGEQRALGEMRRVLRPGGALLLNTAALHVLRGQHAMFSDEVRRATRRSLRAALEHAGFEVVRLTYTNFSLLPFVLPVRLSQRAMGLTTPEETGGDILIPPAPVNAALSWLLRLEAAALRRVDMPLGSSLLALARKPPA
jgi:SAM-dependent methyltransferase